MKIQLKSDEVDIIEALDDHNVKTGVVHKCQDDRRSDCYEVDIDSKDFEKFKNAIKRANIFWEKDTVRMAILENFAQKIRANNVEIELDTPQIKLPEVEKSEQPTEHPQQVIKDGPAVAPSMQQIMPTQETNGVTSYGRPAVQEIPNKQRDLKNHRTVIGNEPLILSSLDKSLIDRVVKQHMPGIKAAYQSALRRNNHLSGRFIIKFVIAKDGSVSSAGFDEAAFHDQFFENKICSEFYKMHFPAPRGGGIVIVAYPINFSSHEEGV